MLLKFETESNKQEIVIKGLKELAKYDRAVAKQDLQTAKQDQLGLPKGSLQYISPEVLRQEFPEYYFADRGLPEDPLRAAGAQEITYQRVTYVGRMVSSRTGGNKGRGKVDANLQPVTYGTKREKGFFEINLEEIDRLEFFQKNNNSLGQVNLLAEKRAAAVEAWYQALNEAFSFGDKAKGIYGALNHPDLPRIEISVPLDATRTAEQNLATLVLMEQSIVRRSNGTEKPTTLILPTASYHALNGQYFTGVNENVINRYLTNSYSVKEVDLVPELEKDSLGLGKFYALMYTRLASKVVRCITKDLTFTAPVPDDDGYRVNFHGEVGGAHYKRPFSAVLLEFPAIV